MYEIDQERLIEIRIKHNYSQKYVALSIGVAPSNVSRWENGKKAPSKENISRLADLYGVSVDYLMGRSDDMTAVSNINMTADEMKLLQDYRSLNEQGQEYIRQTMHMAVPIYIRHNNLAGVEEQKIESVG